MSDMLKRKTGGDFLSAVAMFIVIMRDAVTWWSGCVWCLSCWSAMKHIRVKQRCRSYFPL